MAFNDPIAELLTKIRNAARAKHRYVDINLSKMKVNVVKILKEKGFIANFLMDEKKKKGRVFLKYNSKRQSIIHGLRRISSPGLRRYVEYKKIPYVQNGFGTAIISTSQGVMDDEKAREHKIGGELLCYVW